MALAIHLAHHPSVERGILAIHLPRVTLLRAQTAWAEARAALQSDIANRLAIAVFAQGSTWTDPSSPELTTLSEAISSQLSLHDSESTDRRTNAANLGAPSSFEILKILLEGWLRHAPPFRIQDLMRIAGCSHPTVTVAVEQLDRREEIVRTRDRRVELRRLPRKTLQEITVLSEPLRQTQWLMDASGRPGDPTRLLRKIERANLPGVAVSGVAAARHYHPAFDMNGIPRIDITMWAPRGSAYEPARLTDLDAGLLAMPNGEPGAVAAVHRLMRADPLFRSGPPGLRYADPVEVLLDLYDLRLDAQAQAFVKHLRDEPT
jgi:hypothetical protein